MRSGVPAMSLAWVLLSDRRARSCPASRGYGERDAARSSHPAGSVGRGRRQPLRFGRTLEGGQPLGQLLARGRRHRVQDLGDLFLAGVTGLRQQGVALRGQAQADRAPAGAPGVPGEQAGRFQPVTQPPAAAWARRGRPAIPRREPRFPPAPRRPAQPRPPAELPRDQPCARPCSTLAHSGAARHLPSRRLPRPAMPVTGYATFVRSHA
jgi:hypothetical protein